MLPMFLLWFGLCSIYSAELVSDSALLALAKEGNLDSAFAVSKSRLQNNPLDTFALFMYAKTTSSGEESRDTFLKLLSITPRSPYHEEAIYRIAQYYQARGIYKEAVAYFRQYISEYPEGKWDKPAGYWLGQCFLSIGLNNAPYLDTAESHYIALMKSTPVSHYYHTMALEGVAKTKFAKNDYSGAQRAIESALEMALPDQKPTFHYLQFRIAEKTSDSSAQNYYAGILQQQYPRSLESHNLRRTAPAFFKALPNETSDDSVNTEKNANSESINSASKSAPSYSLQIAAFSNQQNAQTSMEGYLIQGLNLRMIKREKDGEVLYSIRTKIFPSRDLALQYGQSHLKSKGISYYPVQEN